MWVGYMIICMHPSVWNYTTTTFTRTLKHDYAQQKITMFWICGFNQAHVNIDHDKPHIYKPHERVDLLFVGIISENITRNCGQHTVMGSLPDVHTNKDNNCSCNIAYNSRLYSLMTKYMYTNMNNVNKHASHIVIFPFEVLHVHRHK